LAGGSLALMAASLVGCNDTVVQKAEPPRPVLVATAHYDAETPERSFVGTIRPRIESDLGVTVTVHKIIVSNDPDDELSSTRNMIASMR